VFTSSNMTARTFSIYESDGRFKIFISEQHPKRARLVKHQLQGYNSIKAANKDIDLIKAHLESGKQLRTFRKALGTASSRASRYMKNQNEKGLSGCVVKANERSSRKSGRIARTWSMAG
jgi:hypothetical protein